MDSKNCGIEVGDFDEGSSESQEEKKTNASFVSAERKAPSRALYSPFSNSK
jgi:hypothetical protein